MSDLLECLMYLRIYTNLLSATCYYIGNLTESRRRSHYTYCWSKI